MLHMSFFGPIPSLPYLLIQEAFNISHMNTSIIQDSTDAKVAQYTGVIYIYNCCESVANHTLQLATRPNQAHWRLFCPVLMIFQMVQISACVTVVSASLCWIEWYKWCCIVWITFGCIDTKSGDHQISDCCDTVAVWKRRLVPRSVKIFSARANHYQLCVIELFMYEVAQGMYKTIYFDAHLASGINK